MSLASVLSAQVPANSTLEELLTRAEQSGERARGGEAVALWQAADAAADLGEVLVRQGHNGQDQARAWARKGMKWGEDASRLAPTQVEGWFSYARCVGVYSECVDVLTLFAEGIQGKIQRSLQAAYRLDRWYRGGGPVIALARYWQSLPGFAGQDLVLSESLYNEYLAKVGASERADAQAWLWRAQLYHATGRTELARADLLEAQRRGSRGAEKLAHEWGQ